VIRHNHPSMQVTIRPGTILDGTAYQPRNLRPFQMNWSESGRIQQPVHGHERFPGRQTFFRKLAADRQAAIQPKCNEEGPSDSIDVRQTAM